MAFTTFPIPTITFQDWQESVNAKDYGATGNFSTDDTAALQAAIDACFGAAGSEHGQASYVNKPLYIPPGLYKITSPLLLSKVQGAKIFGAGRFATQIYNTAGTGVFTTNGFSYSTVSGMYLNCQKAIGYAQLFVLSNGNLTVTRQYLGISLSQEFVRSTASQASGKFYCEFFVDTEFGFPGVNMRVGLGNATQQTLSGSGSQYLGNTTNGIGMELDSGSIEYNNAIVGTGTAAYQGQTVCMAADLTTKQVWFRVNGGNWNNSGAANPAAPSGGISFGSTTGPFYPYIDIGFASAQSIITINLGGSAYSQAVPAGFGNWTGTLDPTIATQFCCFDADWDGAGAVTLQSNTFHDMYFDGADYGVRLGRSNHMGSENTFYDCFFASSHFAGLQTANFNALGNQVVGGNFQGCYYGIHVASGSVPFIDTQFQQSISNDIFVATSANDCYQITGRSESQFFCKFTRGQPNLNSVLQSVVMDPSPIGTSRAYYLTNVAGLTLQSFQVGLSMHAQLARPDGAPVVGQRYFEITITNAPTIASAAVGIGTPQAINSNGENSSYLGNVNAYTIGYWGDGTVQFNNTTLDTISTYANGDVIGVAFDVTNQKVWFRKNAGNWDNNAAHNPATNTGGYSISTMQPAGSALFPYISTAFAALGATFVANWGGSAFVFGAPGVFTAFNAASKWDAAFMRTPSLVEQASSSYTTIQGCISTIGQVRNVNAGVIIDSQIGLDLWTDFTSNWEINFLRTGLTFDGSGVGTANTLAKGNFYGGAFYATPGFGVTQTVASLPAASAANKGERLTVSNATQTLTAGIGAVVAGVGANIVPVFSDGTNWRIG